MSEILAEEIRDVVAGLVVQANRSLPPDALQALAGARDREESRLGRMVLDVLLENVRCAEELGVPLCQDTGIDVVLIELGQEVRILGDLTAAVNSGIALGTREGLLRSSVCDPFSRKNTGDNTPGVIHLDLVPGDTFKITVMPKGCGSENMSGLAMLPPSAGEDGVVKTVLDLVERAGPNPCPPGVIGVGIGGTMEQAALLAKKALARPVGRPAADASAARLEGILLEAVNRLGIGPVGLGGRVTALGVAVEACPCHIASLPVAVNIQCHAVRHASAAWIEGEWRADASGKGTGAGHGDGCKGVCQYGVKRLELPPGRDEVASLRAGDRVLLSGPVYTGRDQTHRLMAELIRKGEGLPVDLAGQVMYYVGPSPAPPGRPVGSAGPTTSYRMDAYTPLLMERGLLVTMGKGRRSSAVVSAIRRHRGAYLAAIGGAGAYLSRCIRTCEPVAFEGLGPEAMYRMVLEDFPAVVINDSQGGDYYAECARLWAPASSSRES